MGFVKNVCLTVVAAALPTAWCSTVVRERDTFQPDAGITDAAGNEWLKAKFDDPTTNVLASGLMYRVVNSGSGNAHPTASTPCDCHYWGKLTDGTEFDSSYKRGTPTTFAPNQVIKGWTEVMQRMVQGDKFELFIPASLGYGKRGAGGAIPGEAALNFMMEIKNIKGATVPKQESKQEL